MSEWLKFIPMKNQLSFFVLIMMLFMVAAPQVFAGIPIVNEVVKQDQKQIKKVESFKQKGKWKQKLAKKLMVKKADIGESKTAAIIFSVILPPVGVAIFQDGITDDFWMTLLLTIFLFVPGIIYALSIVLKRY